MANKHRPFDGKNGEIFRWLMNNGPAQAATIADALKMQPGHVAMHLKRYEDNLYVKLGKVRLEGGYTGMLWSAWED